MKEYTALMEITITQEEVDDILDAALSVCGYWCDEVSVAKKPTEKLPHNAMSEIITRNGKIRFKIDEPFEKDGKTEFILSIDDMMKGIAENGKSNFEDFDGYDADAVLQIALFGEVVYG